MRTRPIGSIIGAFAGMLFVLLNSAAVPASSTWRILAVATFVAVIWLAAPRGPAVHDQVSPDPRALRIYGVSVAAMAVAIPLGATILGNVFERSNAVPVWVVFVVAAHFLPFAHAFQLPIFHFLAMSLILVSIIGAIPTLAADSASAAGWTGVFAGFVLSIFSAAGPHVSRRVTTRER